MALCPTHLIQWGLADGLGLHCSSCHISRCVDATIDRDRNVLSDWLDFDLKQIPSSRSQNRQTPAARLTTSSKSIGDRCHSALRVVVFLILASLSPYLNPTNQVSCSCLPGRTHSRNCWNYCLSINIHGLNLNAESVEYFIWSSSSSILFLIQIKFTSLQLSLPSSECAKRYGPNSWFYPLVAISYLL